MTRSTKTSFSSCSGTRSFARAKSEWLLRMASSPSPAACPSLWMNLEAEKAAKRVYGVRAVANDIELNLAAVAFDLRQAFRIEDLRPVRAAPTGGSDVDRHTAILSFANRH